MESTKQVYANWLNLLETGAGTTCGLPWPFDLATIPYKVLLEHGEPNPDKDKLLKLIEDAADINKCSDISAGEGGWKDWLFRYVEPELYEKYISKPSPFVHSAYGHRTVVESDIYDVIFGSAENSEPGEGRSWQQHYTASTDGAVLGIGYNSAVQQLLKLVKSPRAPKVDARTQGFLDHGNEQEKYAIEQLQRALGEPIYKGRFCKHPMHNWLAATPDGFTASGFLVEVKVSPLEGLHVTT